MLTRSIAHVHNTRPRTIKRDKVILVVGATMSSAVEQLLEAARFIELQELRQKRQFKISAGSTPPDSPITISQHYSIHNIDYMNLNNSSIVRTKEPLLNEYTVAPPLVVISRKNDPIHSLSSQHSHSSVVSSTIPITANGVQHMANGEDSSQSSLNLSNGSSGYMTSGSNSANSSSSLGLSNLNLSGSQSTSLTNGGGGQLNVNGGSNADHNSTSMLSSTHLPQITTSRRRTISSNSNGSTQRSPCILRADTREVHNKLEKNRRAHLKDCFEQLKKELPHQEEKKTSNLSILGNAFKTVQSLKLKERELEHEMERLAKEKVAQQKRILILKRELSQHLDHTDSSFLLPDNDGSITISGGSIRERFSSESLSEPSLSSSGRARYSSTSSLSSATTTASSPCTTSASGQSTITIVSTSNMSPSSPQRPCSVSPTAIPLSLISVMDSSPQLKLAQVIPNSLTHNGNHIAINFTTSEGLSSTLLTANNSQPSTAINLNGMQGGLNSQSLQIISTTSSTTNKLFGNVKNSKNGMRNTTIIEPSSAHNLLSSNIKDGTKVELLKSSTGNIESSEPPAKVIKLINGSIALAPIVDKDGKLLSSNSLTLSQVVVPLRVNGQTSNSLATIELTNTNAQRNNISQSNGTHLHKLLVSNTTTTNVSPVNTVLTTSTPVASELARLPGGAELNILPAGTNSTSLYRSNGKLTAIVNNGFSFKEFIGSSADTSAGPNRAVHMVTPIQSNSTSISSLTPIVVSQDQNGTNLTHIIASSQQLAGKVVATPLPVNGQGIPIIGTQYLSSTMVKPMVVTVAASNGVGTAVQNASISLPITTAATTNNGLV